MSGNASECLVVQHDCPVKGRLPEGTPTVAVIGAGQLARMMQPAAVHLGIQLRVLASSADECAAAVIPDVLIGAADDMDALSALCDGVAALTVEHEHVRSDALDQLSARTAVHPSGAALSYARDKAALRERLAELGHPQPRWQIVAAADDAASFAEQVSWPIVLKPSRGGYDGRGVFVVDDAASAVEVMAQDLPAGAVWLAEEFVAFAREVAMQVVVSPQGQAVSYPLVQTVQRDGMCAEVVAPCPHSSDELQHQAAVLALSIASELAVVGALAVEMYVVDTGGGETLLVNEIAMRPHNSGHWSIEGAVTSQFENHLRAVLNLPLGDPRARQPYAVMVNIIGGLADNLHYALLHCQARDPQAKIHIYGKEVRPGRKLGHVTVCGSNLEELLERARHAAAYMRGDIDE